MRKVFKRTTVQFIRKTRLDNAARQLIKPHKPIIDIALKCGPSRPGGTTEVTPPPPPPNSQACQASPPTPFSPPP
jgi:hypothetical protein